GRRPEAGGRGDGGRCRNQPGWDHARRLRAAAARLAGRAGLVQRGAGHALRACLDRDALGAIGPAHPPCGGRAQVAMAFLAPLALLLGLPAVPIVVLYMLRLRRREVLVSSTLLWRKLLRDREANAPWQRLRRNLLLLLQLLILAALVLALSRPFLPTPSVVSGSVVVLLDAS